MLKIIKNIFTIGLIFTFTVLLSFSTFAVDFNLTDNSLANNNTSSNTTSNTSTNTSTNTLASSGGTNVSSTTVSNLNNLPESDLGFGNILNILLIVVGILLILLAVAILIRLNK